MWKTFLLVFAAAGIGSHELGAQTLASKPATEITQTIAKELLVLTQTLPSYAVTKMPATKALEHLWVKAIGRKPESISFRWTSQSTPERLIDLELKDIPVIEAIGYIADLASARWRIRGIDGVAQEFELEAIEVADDTDQWVAVALVALNEKGAQNLGLNAGMDSEAILGRLRAYGVRIDPERHAAASFNPLSGQLAAIVSIHDVEFVKALCRLANAGLLVPRS